ncbi:iron exporter MbfA [Bartonella sp. DGB2]|uniref:iron exporter MbfA n=1 Tax=Bartonella sp. DGB2 TaxID=3388426 RepID=UPI00398FDF7E
MFNRLFKNPSRRAFADLSEQEILALAISCEEEDEKIFLDYADGLKQQFPDSAKIFEKMAAEETRHRGRLLDVYRRRFGEHIPLIRREHVRDFYHRPADWLIRPLSIEKVRESAARMEEQAARFYQKAAQHSQDAETRKLLGDLASEERSHQKIALALRLQYTPETIEQKEQAHERKQTLLTWVQPGLAGLMDGSVSTLAPIFAAAFATNNTHQTFLVGLSASIGAGISMGFTEAAHDDGQLSGRGSPIKRGIASGMMTTIGGLGHTVPYLINNFRLATTLAFIIVFIELWAIAFIQNRYMDTPFWRASLQVILGGALVFATGILIGNA